jgi:hypothetical protein
MSYNLLVDSGFGGQFLDVWDQEYVLW